MMVLPYAKEIMIVGRTMWTQSTSVTDGQTDRQTDGQTDRRTDRITITKTVQRKASHGKQYCCSLLRGGELFRAETVAENQPNEV